MARRIRDVPLQERPREKLIKKGVKALSDFELIQLLIGSGNSTADVSQLATKVQKLLQSGAQSLQYDALTKINGLSDAKASVFLAAMELSRRHLIKDDRQFTKAEQLVGLVDDIRGQRQEHLVTITLDGAQRMIAKRTVSVGTLDTVIMHPREVFADAIADRAASIVVIHNHPSGTAQPSHQDVELNQQLAAAARILGLQLLDHIIVTKLSFVSFKKEGLL